MGQDLLREVDRRIHHRVAVHVKVAARTLHAGSVQDFAFSYAKDISIGGMALSVEHLLAEDSCLTLDSTLSLKFKLPDGKYFITTAAKLIWRKNNMLAVQFIDLEPDFLEDIRHYVGRNKKEI